MSEPVEYYADTEMSISAFEPTEQQLACLAYELWERRGRPEGSRNWTGLRQKKFSNVNRAPDSPRREDEHGGRW